MNDLKAHLLAKENSRRFRKVFEQLPSEMRHCIYLRIHQSLKYHEIAEVMQLEINTIKSHLFQAGERLKKNLVDYEADLEIDGEGA